MSTLKLNITMSLDGYVAGPDQSTRHPLGIGGEQLHDWLVPLRAFRESHGEEGGEVSASTPFAEDILGGAGATIMGRNMFGGGPGPWGDDSWKGWWGDEPPFHHPVFVLTHHPREPLQMEGGTTFHFVTDGIESAFDQARAAAGGKGVSLGGGADLPRRWSTTLRQPGRRRPEARAGRGGRRAGSHARQVRARGLRAGSCASRPRPSRLRAAPRVPVRIGDQHVDRVA